MILGEYEMVILDNIRASLFGQSTIVSGADEWLRKKVFSDRDLHGIADEDDLMMIKEFALFSTPALMVLLSEKIALNHYREMRGVNRTQLLVRHIRDIMHFAIAFDISKRSTAQLANEPLIITMELSTEITIGSKIWRTKSRFNSEKLAGKQRELLMRSMGEEVGGEDD
jgi:hypothetical protein